MKKYRNMESNKKETPAFTEDYKHTHTHTHKNKGKLLKSKIK
jgi:hypothetical protein